jgi:hypothetical protein
MVIKPKKIVRSKEYYLRKIRESKLDLEELSGKEKTIKEKQLKKFKKKIK